MSKRMSFLLILLVILGIVLLVQCLGCTSNLGLRAPNMEYKRGGLGSETPGEVASAGSLLAQTDMQAAYLQHQMELEKTRGGLQHREENILIDALEKQLIDDPAFRKKYLEERQRQRYWSPYYGGQYDYGGMYGSPDSKFFPSYGWGEPMGQSNPGSYYR